MPATLRPRRSLLFVPGANPRGLAKARTLAADGLIIDLEDAVAPDAEESARAITAAALAEGGYGGRELVLRVNPIDTPWATPILPPLLRCRSTRCCCRRSRA